MSGFMGGLIDGFMATGAGGAGGADGAGAGVDVGSNATGAAGSAGIGGATSSDMAVAMPDAPSSSEVASANHDVDAKASADKAKQTQGASGMKKLGESISNANHSNDIEAPAGNAYNALFGNTFQPSQAGGHHVAPINIENTATPVPQMAAPPQMIQPPPMMPVPQPAQQPYQPPMSVSDMRAKQRIQNGRVELDAFLQRVYNNVTKRKV